MTLMNAQATDKVGASKVTKGFALTLAGKARLFMGDYAGAKITSNKLSNLENTNLYPVIAGQIYSTHQETSAKK